MNTGLGQQPGKLTWVDGSFPVAKPPAVAVGNTGALLAGDTLPVTAQRSLVAGVDSRCWPTPPTPPPVWGPLIWLTPASLPQLNNGDLVSFWQDTSGNGLSPSVGDITRMPTLGIPGLAGLPELVIQTNQYLQFPSVVLLPSGSSIYLVGTLDNVTGSKTCGPALLGQQGYLYGLYHTSTQDMRYGHNNPTRILTYNAAPGAALLWWARRGLGTVELGCHGLAVGNFTITDQAIPDVWHVAKSDVPPTPATQARLSEVLVWNYLLDDNSHASVLGYLGGKYGV